MDSATPNQTSNSNPLQPIITVPQPKNSKSFLWFSLGILVTLIIIGIGYFIYKNQANTSTQPIPTPIANSIPTPDPTANWKTYTDSNLNYSFQYPPTSCELQRFVSDSSFAICYLPKGSDGGSKNNNGHVISLGFISQNQLNVMGITYCGAYPNDSLRCESFKMGKVTVSIDWGTGGDANANAWISHPNGGIVTFALQPVTAESKVILKQILSTFKFLDEISDTPNWSLYKNDIFDFEIKYPSSVKVTEHKESRQINFSDENLSFNVQMRQNLDPIPLDNYFYMDSVAVRKTTLGGQIANVYEFPEGICEISNCSSPFIAIATDKGQYYYHLIFNKTIHLSNEENLILSSFKFLD